MLAFDPGLRKLGFALIELTPHEKRAILMSLGVFKTKKSNKKHGFYVVDDNIRALHELLTCIRELMLVVQSTGMIVAMCMESITRLPAQGPAIQVSLVMGMIATIARTEGIPLKQASAQQVKEVVCKRGNASKTDIREAVPKIFTLDSGCETIHRSFLNKSDAQVSHAYDAAAIGYACLECEAIVSARNFWFL